MSQALGTACRPGSLACLAEISSQVSIPVLLGQKGLPRRTDNVHGPTDLSRTGSPSRYRHPGGPHCLSHHATYSRILKSETPNASSFPPEWPGAGTSTLGPRWVLASHPCFLSPLASNWPPTSSCSASTSHPWTLSPQTLGQDRGSDMPPPAPPVFSRAWPPGDGALTT